jgi:hypothetical protein
VKVQLPHPKDVLLTPGSGGWASRCPCGCWPRPDDLRGGGCWRPYVNMLVGYEHLAANIRRSGVPTGMRAYEGFGEDAEKYANTVLKRADAFRKVLGR